MAGSVQFDGDVRRVRRRIASWLARATVASVVGPVALSMVAGLLPAAESLLGVAFALGWGIAFPLLAVAAPIAGRRWRLGPADIEASESGLVIQTARRVVAVPVDQIASALVLTGKDELEITTRDGDVLVMRLPSEERGQAAIEALGLGAAQRKVAAVLGHTANPFGAGCSALLAGLGVTIALFVVTAGLGLLRGSGLSALYLFGGAFVLTTLLVQRLSEPKRIVVGTDGVRIRGAFRTRFVPRAAIDYVTATPAGDVVIVKRYAEKIVIAGTGARGAGLAGRIEDALGVGPGSGNALPAGVLERDGRSLAEWRAALRALASQDGGYRNVALGADALLEVARDDEAPVEERLGAAIALGATADETTRERLRVTTEGFAGERLRIAMDKASRDELDEEALEEALREARVV